MQHLLSFKLARWSRGICNSTVVPENSDLDGVWHAAKQGAVQQRPVSASGTPLVQRVTHRSLELSSVPQDQLAAGRVDTKARNLRVP